MSSTVRYMMFDVRYDWMCVCVWHACPAHVVNNFEEFLKDRTQPGARSDSHLLFIPTYSVNQTRDTLTRTM